MHEHHIWPIFAAPLLVVADWAAAVANIAPDPTYGVPYAAIGSTGILAWYLWYTTCRALPAITKQHREERTAMQAHYEKVLTDIKNDHCASNAKLTGAIERLADQVESKACNYPIH